MHHPRVQILNALKRIIRYVKGTLDHGLQLYRSKVNELTAYSDADWVGCPVECNAPLLVVVSIWETT